GNQDAYQQKQLVVCLKCMLYPSEWTGLEGESNIARPHLASFRRSVRRRAPCKIRRPCCSNNCSWPIPRTIHHMPQTAKKLSRLIGAGGIREVYQILGSASGNVEC